MNKINTKNKWLKKAIKLATWTTDWTFKLKRCYHYDNYHNWVNCLDNGIQFENAMSNGI